MQQSQILLFRTLWNFFQIFSIHRHLNPCLWNLQVQNLWVRRPVCLYHLALFFFFSSNQTRIWPILYFSIYNLHDTKFAFLNQIQARCLCVFPGQCTRHWASFLPSTVSVCDTQGPLGSALGPLPTLTPESSYPRPHGCDSWVSLSAGRILCVGRTVLLLPKPHLDVAAGAWELPSPVRLDDLDSVTQVNSTCSVQGG